ncbi:MAG: class F sortase [Patescibacteria group bacterium]
MRTSLFSIALGTAFLLVVIVAHTNDRQTPLVPDTALAQAEEQTPAEEVVVRKKADHTPALLNIPAIDLASPIQAVGVTADGAMDVPSGRTNNVGWYKDGATPGKKGSAVLDAHVYAAFSNLKNVEVGDDVYVTDADGRRLHFEVTERVVYALADVPLQKLFNRADAKRLNLITCAGEYSIMGGIYDHRLIVYTKLVD